MKLRIILIFIVFTLAGCKKSEKNDRYYMEVRGSTQGTTYQVKYSTNDKENLRPEFERIFKEIDTALSTYNKESVITKVNKNQITEVSDKYFKDVFYSAMDIAAKTQGAFDITVAPLVNAWGFGFEKIPQVDSSKIDSLLKFVGYKKVNLKDGKIYKDDTRLMLDMNAIAQGYTVDVVAQYLNDHNVNDYLVEVGGEVRTRGKNPDNKPWRIGIDKPVDTASAEGRKLQAIIELDDKSLATSGNYRKYYVKDGIKYSHTINPETGYPVRHNLLSVTVLSDECVAADAYATAFMVMGLEKSLEMVNEMDNLEAFFIYSGEDGRYQVEYSENIKNLITVVE